MFILNQPTERLAEVFASVDSSELDEGGVRKNISWVCGKLREAIQRAFLKKLKPKQRFKESWVQTLMGSAIEELHIRVEFNYQDQVLTDNLKLWNYRHLRCYVRFSNIFKSLILFYFALN